MKNYMKKRLTASILPLCLILILISPAAVFASDPLTNYLDAWPQMTDIEEGSAVVIDADNGAILYSLNRDDIHFPASITKILTCLLTIENTQMSDVVIIGEKAMEVAVAGNANIAPVLGEEFTVEECLYMLMLKSANDIAVQLAIQVAGSVSAFSDMMNQRAAAIGCQHTHFNNPNGLPDESHVTSAYDMALIMRECLKNETFRKLIATTEYTVPRTNKTAEVRTYENHNKLILPGSEYYYADCIGGKTGYTDVAGRTLIAAAKRDGRTLIAVTMAGSTRQDFVDMKALFEYGFTQFATAPYDDGQGAAGTYTLPVSADMSLLAVGETQTLDSGETITNLMYQDKVKVGEIKKAGLVTEVSEEPLNKDDSVEPSAPETTSPGAADDEKTSTPKEKNRRSLKTMRLTVLIAVIVAVLALIVIIVDLLIIRSEAKKEEARRRRAARKRRERGY